MDTWRFIHSVPQSPSINMGTDYALWQTVKQGKAPPVLRLYTWNPSSVSLGYGQKPERVVDVSFCRMNGIPIVMRPTGGSAIFHDLELTYSVVGHKDFHPTFGNPLESYMTICRALIRGLERLGLKSEVRGYSEGKEPSTTDKACFILSSRHDVVCNGRKIIGSAQKRDDFSFLQHGSILLDIRGALWEKVFSRPVDFSKVGCLRGMTGRDIGPEELVPLLKNGWEELFGVALEEGALTEEESAEAGRLAEKQFSPL